MICRPVLIVGAPRCGTSLLQKILRNHPEFHSLPSESELIWDQYCHPRLRNWESECLDETHATPALREEIRRKFEQYIWPARYWSPVERADIIWGFRRVPAVRALMRAAYRYGSPLLRLAVARNKPMRLIEKTASNCFRLGFVNEIFPDAKIIFPLRDGRNSVNSLINGWMHPTRFFTYDVPKPLSIGEYPYQRWKFVLPAGWGEYVDRPLEEVCAFQWRSCNESMLAETAKHKYDGRVLPVKLEELTRNPNDWLRKLAEFVEVPYDDYFRRLAADLPVINSPDGDISRDKWQRQNRERVERIIPEIAPTMQRLGYEIDGDDAAH